MLIGSVSVISEAIHSAVDLLAAVIAWFSVSKSGKPADQEHPWGHGKVENISGTIEALLIFFAAGWIIFEAVRKLNHPEPLEGTGWGMGVMLLSALMNIGVSRHLFKVGNETDSLALKADAWHLRTDVYTSAGVMVGLGVIWVCGWLLPTANVNWLDPIAAIVVALLIIKAAYQLTRESARDLLDVRLPPEEEKWIRDCIETYEPTIRGVHGLRTRKSGADRFVEFHLEVPAGMSVRDSHDITERIQKRMKAHFTGIAVTIHVEPWPRDGSIRSTDEY